MSLEGKTIRRVAEYEGDPLLVFTDGTSVLLEGGECPATMEPHDAASTTEMLHASARSEEDAWLRDLKWEREDGIRRAMSCEERTARKREREEKERQAFERARAKLKGMDRLLFDSHRQLRNEMLRNEMQRQVWFGVRVCQDCGEEYCVNAPKSTESYGAVRVEMGTMLPDAPSRP